MNTLDMVGNVTSTAFGIHLCTLECTRATFTDAVLECIYVSAGARVSPWLRGRNCRLDDPQPLKDVVLLALMSSTNAYGVL